MIVLDPGHGDKGGRWDPGAVRGPWVEADIVRAFAPRLARALAGHGIQSTTLGQGPYARRHRAAEQAMARHRGPAVYLALHVDSGTHRRGLAMHDARSPAGAALAAAVALAHGGLPELEDCATVACGVDGWTSRAYSVIRWCYAMPAGKVGLLLELGNIQEPSHDTLWQPDGLERASALVADGLAAWLATRTGRSP